MATRVQCVCHLIKEEESGKITPFTEVSWQKFRECNSRWKLLDGRQRELAEENETLARNPEPRNEHGYHRSCYKR